MVEWFIYQPVVSGLITFLLMWSDWLLTIAQEKERAEHYSEHYQSYPANTIEGHPAFQSSVPKRQLINPKHAIAALAIGTVVSIMLLIVPRMWCELLLGYVWGLFVIVDTQHLSNLIGYRAGRQGIHGKLWMHQRTGYLVQSGRYFSFALFLLVLSILSGSVVIYGVTIAGFVSSLRQLIWLKRIPKIEKEDFFPGIQNPESISAPEKPYLR
jgi:hypothetical protein